MNKFRCSHSRVEGNPTLNPLIFLLYSNAEASGVRGVETGQAELAVNFKIFDCFYDEKFLMNNIIDERGAAACSACPQIKTSHTNCAGMPQREQTLNIHPPECSQVIYNGA